MLKCRQRELMENISRVHTHKGAMFHLVISLPQPYNRYRQKTGRRKHELFESEIFYCSGRGDELYKSCQTSVYFPAVLSNHIAKLEDYFGVQLFDRNTPLTLTVAGQRLLKNAQTIMDVKKQTELELQDIRDFRSAELTIGIPSARGSVMLPPLIQKFHREFPQVQLHLLEGTSLEITEALYKGKVDFTIGFEPDDLGNIHTEVLQEEHTMILVPAAVLEQFFDSSERKKLEAESMLPIRVFKNCPFIKMKHENWIGAVFEKSA